MTRFIEKPGRFYSASPAPKNLCDLARRRSFYKPGTRSGLRFSILHHRRGPVFNRWGLPFDAKGLTDRSIQLSRAEGLQILSRLLPDGVRITGASAAAALDSWQGPAACLSWTPGRNRDDYGTGRL